MGNTARVLRGAQNNGATAPLIRRQANCGRSRHGSATGGAGAFIRGAVTVRGIRARGA